MSFFTSNGIVDGLILSCIFVLIIIVSPVSAFTQDFSHITFGGEYYTGDVYGPYTETNMTAVCEGYGSPSKVNQWLHIGSKSPIVTKTNFSGAWYTKGNTWSAVYNAVYPYFGAGQECYNGGTDTYTYITFMPLRHYTTGTRPAPSIGVSGSPSSGSPSYISVISISGLDSDFDTVTYFNITAPNSSVYNLASPSQSVSIDAEGEWIIRATATNSGGSGSASASVWGNTVEAPVASFSCTPTNTTSPASITCSDTSIHQPTTWAWQLDSYGISMSPGGSYGSGIFTLVNSSQNIVFSADGSGTINVRLTAGNSFGSSQHYKPNYITISGLVPTPTSTPAIPWPNQTGVCIGSAITLGSGAVRDHIEHYQLTDPMGDTYSGQYATGQENYVSGQPFFTALKGQYIYQEFPLVGGGLEWQQSYITDYCNIPTTQPTGEITTFPTTVPPYVTGGPTYNPYPVPTITLVNPGGEIDISTGWVNLSTVPTQLPQLPEYINQSNWRDTVCGYGAIGSLLCPLMAVVYAVLGTASDIVIMFMSFTFAPLSFFTTALNFAQTLFVTILSSWLSVGGIIVAVIGQVVNVIPDKVKNVITLIMCLEIIKQCYELWDWVG